MKSFSPPVVALAWVSALVAPTVSRAQTVSLTPAALAAEHESHRFVMTPAPCLTPDAVAKEIGRLAAKRPDQVRVEVIGRSFHDREIRMITMGRGPKTILLWSQMHGDEPS